MTAWSAITIVGCALCSLTACDSRQGANYIQLDYAKDPDTSCEARSEAFYAEKVKSKAGIEELIFLYCQSDFRSSYHLAELQRGSADKQAHIDKGIACGEVGFLIAKTFQRAGVVRTGCPGSEILNAKTASAKTAPPGCDKSDADVKLIKFYDEARRYFAVMGELVNNCTEPIGIHVRFIGYDKNGLVADIRETWPASVRNIPPKSREPFNMQLFRFDPAIKKIDAEVIEVRRW